MYNNSYKLRVSNKYIFTGIILYINYIIYYRLQKYSEFIFWSIKHKYRTKYSILTRQYLKLT